jgi:prepilin-type N-terminal cleavage/methylation domain-containing protein/prepilin-type processing-associated H-X9-DG protein
MKTPGLLRGPRVRRVAHGFTILELVVVLAVIGILAGLLLPALFRARQAGHTAVCQNNLRQWGLGLRLYVDDHASYAPYSMGDSPRAGERLWYTRLARTLGIAEVPWTFAPRLGPRPAQGIQTCPGLSSTPLSAGGGSLRGVGSYGYNVFGVGVYELGLGGGYVDTSHSPLDAPGNLRVTRDQAVLVPSDMIAVGDAIVGWSLWGGADENAGWAHDHLGPNLPEPTALIGSRPGFFSATDLEAMRAVIRRRHGGRWQMVFCDGHVESGQTADWFEVRRDTVRQRWNNDNQPHAWNP